MTYFITDIKDGQEIGMNKTCTRKVSYYTNVHVRRKGNKFILRSYSTDVCSYENGRFEFNGAYSRSTVTHIGGFIDSVMRCFNCKGNSLIDAFINVQSNENIKSCTEFYDRIKWIDFNLGKYCVNEKRQSDEDYIDRVYCY